MTRLVVFTDAAFNRAVQTTAREFEKSHPNVLVFVIAGDSTELASDLRRGAPVDVFVAGSDHALNSAPRDTTTLRTVAANRLVVVQPQGLGATLEFRKLSGLSKIASPNPSSLAGFYTRQLLGAASKKYGPTWLSKVQSRLMPAADSRAVLMAVRSRKAAAGILLASDAGPAIGGMRKIDIPAVFQPRIEYPAAVVLSSRQRPLDMQFLDALCSARAGRLFAELGFSMPDRR